MRSLILITVVHVHTHAQPVRTHLCSVFRRGVLITVVLAECSGGAASGSGCAPARCEATRPSEGMKMRHASEGS